MTDYRSAVSALALAESWRQNNQPSPQVLILERPDVFLIRRLNQEEKLALRDSFMEGDFRYRWFGAFSAKGTLVGISDDYDQMAEGLIAQGKTLHHSSGPQ